INGLIMTNSKYYKYYYIFIIILAASAIFWNNVFIPIYGIMGSAMATMISVALYNILLLAFLKIKMKIHPFSYSNIKVLLLLILTITIDMLLYKFKNPYIDATIRSTFFIVLYSVLNIVFKTSEDINAFLKSITSENINLKIKKYIHGFKNK
ncbi:MAG: polysaccharide biosynthesis C-terminal domain-containing protein, partial [Bacteroidota bacterium]|nr:polysaccharide biosynthesis C-terminal domain-containing protein [Bacteroidota bacterium]